MTHLHGYSYVIRMVRYVTNTKKKKSNLHGRSETVQRVEFITAHTLPSHGCLRCVSTGSSETSSQSRPWTHRRSPSLYHHHSSCIFIVSRGNHAGTFLSQSLVKLSLPSLLPLFIAHCAVHVVRVKGERTRTNRKPLELELADTRRPSRYTTAPHRAEGYGIK